MAPVTTISSNLNMQDTSGLPNMYSQYEFPLGGNQHQAQRFLYGGMPESDHGSIGPMGNVSNEFLAQQNTFPQRLTEAELVHSSSFPRYLDEGQMYNGGYSYDQFYSRNMRVVMGWLEVISPTILIIWTLHNLVPKTLCEVKKLRRWYISIP